VAREGFLKDKFGPRARVWAPLSCTYAVQLPPQSKCVSNAVVVASLLESSTFLVEFGFASKMHNIDFQCVSYQRQIWVVQILSNHSLFDGNNPLLMSTAFNNSQP